MNTKNRLNCYVFSNLMVSFLALNILMNNGTTELVKKTSVNTLNKIYEDEIIVETVDVPEVLLSSNEEVLTPVSINNEVKESSNTDYINYVKPSYNSLTGINLVNYAKNFLGLRYVSAGNSLTSGTDCSGFTRLIYKEFGISLGRTVSSQIYAGTYVSKNDLKPGDLVFYSYGSIASHVAIYMGDGLIIHESNPRDGVKISSVNIMNYITARRLITSDVVSSDSVTVSENKQEVVETVKEEVISTPSETKEEMEIKENIIETNKPNEEVLEVVSSSEEEVKEEIKEEIKEENVSSEEIVSSDDSLISENINNGN